MIVCDTDIIVDVSRRYPPAVEWFDGIIKAGQAGNGEELAVPGIVRMELLEGCRNKSELERVKKLIRPVSIVWPNESACNYALVLLDKFRLSNGLRKYDALIAVTALGAGQPLHTHNIKHFGIIPGLRTTQPYVKSSRKWKR